MIKKKKFLLTLVMLPLFGISLAGCADASGDADNYDTEQTSEVTADDDGDDMDEEVDQAAKAYYGDDTDEYNEFSKWHDKAE